MNRIRNICQQVLGTWAKKVSSDIFLSFIVGGQHLHGGTKWVPLKNAFRTPLYRTGNLQSKSFMRLSGLNVSFGNSSPYAKFHQYGTKTLPVRKVVDVTRSDIEKLKSTLKSTLETYLNGGV